MSEYRKHPSLNFSKLAMIADSPLHYKIGEKAQTQAMAFGTVVHMAVLEPDKFRSLYVCEPNIINGEERNNRLKAHKEYIQQWRAEQAPDAVILTPTEMDCLVGMLNSLKLELSKKRDYMTLAEIMKIEGREVPFFNDMFGRPCKALLDMVGETSLGRTVVDFKKVGRNGDASPENFTRIVSNRHYDAQAYWYKTIAEADAFLWVVVEEKPIHEAHPYHSVAIYNAEPFLEIGEKKVHKWLKTLEECEKTDDWPSYTKGVETLYPAAWAIKQYEEM